MKDLTNEARPPPALAGQEDDAKDVRIIYLYIYIIYLSIYLNIYIYIYIY